MSVDYKCQPDNTSLKIISVHSDARNNREHMNRACWQNAEFTDVKGEAAYRYHWA